MYCVKVSFLILETWRITLHCTGSFVRVGRVALWWQLTDWFFLYAVWIKWKTTGESQWAWCQFRVWVGHMSNHLCLGKYFCGWMFYHKHTCRMISQKLSVVHVFKSQLKRYSVFPNLFLTCEDISFPMHVAIWPHIRKCVVYLVWISKKHDRESPSDWWESMSLLVVQCVFVCVPVTVFDTWQYSKEKKIFTFLPPIHSKINIKHMLNIINDWLSLE